MPRVVDRLSAVGIKSLPPGKHPDGRGLYIQVLPGGTRSWVFRFMRHGKPRAMGLGAFPAVGLAEARRIRTALSDRLRAGEDPIAERHRERVTRRVEAARTVTFEAAAIRHVEANRAGWSNAKHAEQWLSTLRTYAFPVFKGVAVPDIDTRLVLKAIEPIWTTKTETASRVRMRIESVLDSATARGERTGDNPARWKGHLAKLLPARSKVKKVEHFAAMPYPNCRRSSPSL
jgi:hypothetical protein